MEFQINDVGHGILLEDQQGEMKNVAPYLVPLLPQLFTEFECPECSGRVFDVKGSEFCGIHVMGQYKCLKCTLEFHRDLPVGFGVDHPLTISENGELYGDKEGWEWISTPLLQGYLNKNNAPIAIERKVYADKKEVVVLNTLDYLYGHVLLKLYNASYYLEKFPDKGLILILPKMFAWLIPKGVAEVWLVDQRLGEIRGWHNALNNWVQEQLPRYESVDMGKAYAHPEFLNIDISAYTGISPFPMEQFVAIEPHITFVARQDRIWFKNRAFHFVYRVVRKLGLKDNLGKWWLKQQNALMARTMARIAKQLPNAAFSVVGLGTVGGFPGKVNDLRTEQMNDDIERSWCTAYAKSQVVIGVHGSNMLLPTAHAAGCVEILPDDRFGNIVQDISVRYSDRMQLFLYRFVDEFASPRIVANNVISMFKDFEVYYRDNRTNTFKKEQTA